jgi:tRNA (mo5U34)-methyltransferase
VTTLTLAQRVASAGPWFHQIRLTSDLVTPGWSDPTVEKMPYYGLPDDMTDMRVLDIGPAEGFFSFEAERRGAAEVVAIDSFPDSVQRFNICREALASKATIYLTSVYDLTPRAFGTFDLVMCFGVLYHLRHPLFALERVFSVTSDRLLLQTASFEDPALGEMAAAQFHPFGIDSGPADDRRHDPTVFWVPNEACVRGMLRHVGFDEIVGQTLPPGAVFSARSPNPRPAQRPVWDEAPWS